METKKILMLYTGGTIAGEVANEVSEVKNVRAVKEFKIGLSKGLLDLQKKWNQEVKINSIVISEVDSSDITNLHWTKMCDAIHENYSDFDAFIITHGTNTLGYTCSALSFALENLNKPVVLTGSQVPFGQPGTDALVNLENAIKVATYPYADVKGVIAVFGSHIISGTRVKKTTEFDYDAFESFSSISIGRIGRIILINKELLGKHNSYLSKRSRIALKKETLRVQSQFDMRIASIADFPGMSETIFNSLLKVKNGNERYYKAYILRTFGAGDPSKETHKILRKLKKLKIPVAISTQAHNGNANCQVNESGQKLFEEDLVIPTFDMSIESIVTKMAWLLAQNLPYERMKFEMHQDLHGEINVLYDSK